MPKRQRMVLFVNDNAGIGTVEKDHCYFSNDTIIIDREVFLFFFCKKNNHLYWFSDGKSKYVKTHSQKIMSEKNIEKLYTTHKDLLKDYKLRITSGVLEIILDN